jgi:DNA polymerase I-like protein with 3'-5' exonuclease and polymerase domains
MARHFLGLHEIEGIVFDTSLAAYVLNPGVRTHEISDLLERYGDGSIFRSDFHREFAVASAACTALLFKNFI